MQERLDGQLLVCYQGKVLTPGEAPPLAAARPEGEPGTQMSIDMPDLTAEEPKANKQRTGLGWEGDWYRDESRKRIHRDLVRTGMERARQQGKRIGRPRVSERPEFSQRFAAVVLRIGLGGLSQRQAAKELAIGYATLKRLLDAGLQPSDLSDSGSQPHIVSDTDKFAEVVY